MDDRGRIIPAEQAVESIADAIKQKREIEARQRLTNRLIRPYLFNRNLRRMQYKLQLQNFRAAAQAAAGTELRRMHQEFEDKVAVKAAMNRG